MTKLRGGLGNELMLGALRCCEELQEWNERALAVLLPERIEEFTYRVEIMTLRHSGEVLVLGGLVGEGASSAAECMRRRLESLALETTSLELSSWRWLICGVVRANEEYLQRLLQNAALALDSLERRWFALAKDKPPEESNAVWMSHLSHLHHQIGASKGMKHFVSQLNRAFSAIDSE